MLASNFFTTARLKEMRDEICRDGFVADKFLADQPDCPVFGVNLACLYPFPTSAHDAYETLFTQLASLDPGVYVYPLWETHVTIVTFINFTQQIAPTRERTAELKAVTRQVIAQLRPIFSDIKPFDLWIEHPVISRKAAILPLSDPSDAIAQIRSRVAENLARDPSLQTKLSELGLNIPPLVHSTIMRFTKVPDDTSRFLSNFDKIATDLPRIAMRVDEIYITTETKPYMREGEIFHQFPL
jgi:hypothetical protein